MAATARSGRRRRRFLISGKGRVFLAKKRRIVVRFLFEDSRESKEETLGRGGLSFKWILVLFSILDFGVMSR